MSIKEFAEAHRLRFRKDGSGDDAEYVIDGRVGESNISVYSDSEFCVAFVTDGKKAPRTQLFNSFKAACLDAGMTPRQIGDAEGVFSFDPGDSRQAKVAIKSIRAKARKQVSPERRAALAATLAAARAARASTLDSRV